MAATHSRAYRQNSVPAPPPSTFPNVNDVASLEILEYPFLTLTTYPSGFIVHIGKFEKELTTLKQNQFNGSFFF